MSRRPSPPARAPLPAPRYTPWAATLLALTLCVLWLLGLGILRFSSN